MSSDKKPGLFKRLLRGIARVLGISAPGRSLAGRLAHLGLVAMIAGGLVYGWRAKRAQIATDAAPTAGAVVAETGDAQKSATSDAEPKSPTEQAAASPAPDKTEAPAATTPPVVAEKPADKPATQPAAGSLFRDTRDVAAPDKSADKPAASPATIDIARATRPVAAPAPAAPNLAVPAANAPAATTVTQASPAGLFRDTRALATDMPKPTGVFSDARSLTEATRAGLFTDTRALSAPSFRDERPVVGATAPETTSTTQIAAASATAAVATAGSPASVAAATAKPFEMGWFLEDRNPMLRDKLQDAAAAAALAAKNATAPAADKPVGVAAATPAAQTPAPAPVPVATIPTAAALPAQAATPQAQPALPTIVAVNAPPIRVDAGSCSAPELSSEPLDGGRMRVLVNASCRPGEAVQVSYGGAELIRKLDAFGRLDLLLDCFAGAEGGVLLRFADGSQQTMPVNTRDLDKVSKFAVVWRSPVNLDLHVFEYAARYDQTGHVWARQASNLAGARAQILGDKRGHGFISTTDDEASLGDKVEVYTFLHSDEQSGGAISLALDYETRGEKPTGATCGQGTLAEVDFQVVMLPRGGQSTRQAGVLTRVECGRRIAREARLNQSALPGLRIRR